MKFSNPCFKDGCWDATTILNTVIDTMEKDFRDYPIELHWQRGSSLEKHIELGGPSPGGGEDYYGSAGWLQGWVFTETMVADAVGYNENQEKVHRNRNSHRYFIDHKMVGTAIGNLGSHEVGHLVGTPGYFTKHEPCEPFYLMSTGESCIAIWPLSRNDLDWSPQSKNWLTSRFKR